MPRIERIAVELIDTEFVVVSIAPKDADGRNIVGLTGATWAFENEIKDDAADPSPVCYVEPALPDQGDVPAGANPEYSRRIRTGTPGKVSLVISYTKPSGELLEEVIPFWNKIGEVNALNASVGPARPEPIAEAGGGATPS